MLVITPNKTNEIPIPLSQGNSSLKKKKPMSSAYITPKYLKGMILLLWSDNSALVMKYCANCVNTPITSNNNHEMPTGVTHEMVRQAAPIIGVAIKGK